MNTIGWALILLSPFVQLFGFIRTQLDFVYPERTYNRYVIAAPLIVFIVGLAIIYAARP